MQNLVLFQHINEAVIFYKLHFIQYSIVNDFFIFRVITPSVASEATRFEITFIPGSGAVQLINRTIVVDEGAMQKVQKIHSDLIITERKFKKI